MNSAATTPVNSGSLAHIQAWMQNALIWSGRQTDADEIRQQILPSATLTPAQRLGIYQRGYYARLLQCLEGQFRALRHALGEDLFRDFATEYLRAYPSHSPTLSELGARFSQWLAENRPDLHAAEKEPWIDFMIDLARYEWAVYLFFDKLGHEGRPLATAETPDVELVPQTTLELHQFAFPVATYYHAIAAGEPDPPIPEAEDSHFVIVRKNYHIGILRLTAPQHQLLTSLIESQSIPESLMALATAHSLPLPHVQQAWENWKSPWCEAGLFGLRSDSASRQEPSGDHS